MIPVASKELKNRLGKYLALVREGKTLRITDRGRPIGCIIPAQSPKAGKRAEALARLVAEGAVRLGSGRLARHKPTVMSRGKTIAQMVAEDRR